MHTVDSHHRQAESRHSVQRPRPKGARGRDYAINDSYIVILIGAAGVFAVMPLIIWLANGAL